MMLFNYQKLTSTIMNVIEIYLVRLLLTVIEECLGLVIIGATGLTCENAIKEVERLAKDKPFTWGVAGRRKEVLESVLKEFASDSVNIRVIVADLKDEESLKKMAKQVKVNVNCCCPYRFYGGPVLETCIAAKTHHADVSGEAIVNQLDSFKN